ncbi:ABC transporter substrate-binding protein [Georgenia alba]|uniref:ABC transporter substrate-binding protein n=1 Tax=Georgenia alba TaxID=2233858 RepID=A0ABW2QE08_9MICO
MTRTRAGVLAATAALTLAACSAPAGGPGETGREEGPGGTAAPAGPDGGPGLTIGLTYTPDIQFAPFYVAAEQGYYEEAGVDVTLRHHGSNEGLFTAVESGREDVVVAGGDEMLQARSEGVPLLDVATLYQEYPVVGIVPADSDIRTAEDLRGRSVGIPGPFGETYFGLLAMLEEAGLTEDDVQVQHIGFTQQAALTAGHVDAVMGYVNNDAVRFETAGTPVRTIPVAEEDVPLVGIGLGVLDDLAEEDPAAVAAVVEATLRGVEDVAADPERAIELSTPYVPDLAREDARAAARATLEATVPLYGDTDALGTQDAETWQAMADLMAARDLLARPVPAEEAWTDQYLPGASN